MELVEEPDIYSPSVDQNGNYVDRIPSFCLIKKGLRCPCGSRKDKIYETNTIFSAHIKSKTHQKWIESLNLNKVNYYVENEELKETIMNQRLIIAKYEKALHNKIITIDYLSLQLTKYEKKYESLEKTFENINLLDL
jgi:hypothetical protein